MKFARAVVEPDSLLLVARQAAPFMAGQFFGVGDDLAVAAGDLEKSYQ